MADFQFLQNPISKKWVILSPRRAKRPDVANGIEPVCPFCLGKELNDKEVYRFPLLEKSEIQSTKLETNPNNQNQNVQNVSDFDIRDSNLSRNWLVRVVNNKFPFAPIHEVIVHSPDHDKNFGELPLSQVELILKTYRERYNIHQEKGQVYIFHNRHEKAGESLPHPHSQLAVAPFEVEMDIPQLFTPQDQDVHATNRFVIFCPLTSQWPDEVWIAPKERGRVFGEIKDAEIADLAFTLSRLIQILDLRHGEEFPFNFYIYPGGDWYLRIIPRVKVLGGFEIGTGVFINTQDPKETIEFIREHFDPSADGPDKEKIKISHQAAYRKRV